MQTSTYVPVQRYTDEYCKALTENYKQETMRSYERWITKGESAQYYGERVVEMSGEILQFMLLLTKLQEKFTNQLGGQHPQNTLDMI